MSVLDRRFLTTEQASGELHVSPATIRDWARRGLLVRAGGTARRPLWRVSDLLVAKRAPKPRRADPTRIP